MIPHPGRHVLGLGFGGVPRPGITPPAAMAGYLDEMDGPATPNPLPRTPMRRILAAYGPKMLELARDRSAGALTYHVTVAHTAQARETLGPDAFLGVEHAVLFESDPARARAAAREHLHRYLTTPYNIAKFRRLGYADERSRAAAATVSSTISCSGVTSTRGLRNIGTKTGAQPLQGLRAL
ncbi:hypothetical protein ACFYOK_13645 [Microbispora bryophytorum]|uniref:hypothetical protein n=1 Tax=Microbispora bryophytorum TaxID=1460882 RepID=UPI0033CECE65